MSNEYWDKNKETINKKRRLKKSLLSVEQKKKLYDINKAWIKKNPERQKLNLKRYRDKLRVNALSYYSNNDIKCNCCGEKEINFMCLDHINNDGNKHRKKIFNKNTGSISSWLKSNNYPPGFQVLCHNCNMAKGFYGVCPHNKLSTEKDL